MPVTSGAHFVSWKCEKLIPGLPQACLDRKEIVMQIIARTTTLVLVAIILVGSSIANCSESRFDLTGEWDTAVYGAGWDSKEYLLEKDVVKIVQNGNDFVGVRLIGGRHVGKNDEWIKGRIVNGIVESVSIRYTGDPVTFALSWGEARATVGKDGTTLAAQMFIKSLPYYVTAELTKRK